MSATIQYFSTMQSADWRSAVKAALDAVEIFDSVSITESGYALVCYIGDTAVFKVNTDGRSPKWYNTNGTLIFDVNDTSTHTESYVAQTDNCVFFSIYNSYGNREYIFGKDASGDAWWHFFYSKEPSQSGNMPRTAYFDTTLAITYSATSETSNNYSRLTQCVSVGNIGYTPIGLYQFYIRQSNLPTSVGQSTEVCYKVDIAGNKFVTSGQILLPYTE